MPPGIGRGKTAADSRESPSVNGGEAAHSPPRYSSSWKPNTGSKNSRKMSWSERSSTPKKQAFTAARRKSERKGVPEASSTMPAVIPIR